MIYKSLASPGVSPGLVIKDKKIVVPNQSMSLHEILERFTRNEELPIGRDVQYHESEDDLEKIAHMDLVDREEYADKFRETQKAYKKQEAAKQKAAKEKIAAELREEVRKSAESKT